MYFIETSLQELYKNSIKAFPSTQKRQYATDTVLVEHLDWVPFLGVKTLFIKGLIKNEGRKNESIILFKNIKYENKKQKNNIEIMTSTGKKVFIEQISLEKNDVLVRCSCKDFFWRFMHFDKLDKSLFGRNRKKYEALKNPGSSNPQKLSGVCKHLMKMGKILGEAGLLI